MACAKSVAVVGSFACVAADEGGMHVIDLGNPTALRRIGGYETKYISTSMLAEDESEL